jgi:hypothetical protein
MVGHVTTFEINKLFVFYYILILVTTFTIQITIMQRLFPYKDFATEPTVLYPLLR